MMTTTQTDLLLEMFHLTPKFEPDGIDFAWWDDDKLLQFSYLAPSLDLSEEVREYLSAELERRFTLAQSGQDED